MRLDTWFIFLVPCFLTSNLGAEGVNLVNFPSCPFNSFTSSLPTVCIYKGSRHIVGAQCRRFDELLLMVFITKHYCLEKL